MEKTFADVIFEAWSMELRAESKERSVKRVNIESSVREMGKYSFRFEKLEIWKKSIDIGRQLFKIADDLEKKHLYRFADQLRGAWSVNVE